MLMLDFFLNCLLSSLHSSPSIPCTTVHITRIRSVIPSIRLLLTIVRVVLLRRIIVSIIIRIVLLLGLGCIGIVHIVRVMIYWLIRVVVLRRWRVRLIVRLVVWLIIRLIVVLLLLLWWRVWTSHLIWRCHLWLLWFWHHFPESIKEFFFIDRSIRVLIDGPDGLQRLLFGDRHTDS